MAPKDTQYSVLWQDDPRFKAWLRKSDKPNGATRAKCIWCNSDFSVASGGIYDVKRHMNGADHKKIAEARLKQKSVVDFTGKNLQVIFLLQFNNLFVCLQQVNRMMKL